jgi:hypothetical protein
MDPTLLAIFLLSNLFPISALRRTYTGLSQSFMQMKTQLSYIHTWPSLPFASMLIAKSPYSPHFPVVHLYRKPSAKDARCQEHNPRHAGDVHRASCMHYETSMLCTGPKSVLCIICRAVCTRGWMTLHSTAR